MNPRNEFDDHRQRIEALEAINDEAQKKIPEYETFFRSLALELTRLKRRVEYAESVIGYEYHEEGEDDQV